MPEFSASPPWTNPAASNLDAGEPCCCCVDGLCGVACFTNVVLNGVAMPDYCVPMSCLVTTEAGAGCRTIYYTPCGVLGGMEFSWGLGPITPPTYQWFVTATMLSPQSGGLSAIPNGCGADVSGTVLANTGSEFGVPTGADQTYSFHVHVMSAPCPADVPCFCDGVFPSGGGVNTLSLLLSISCDHATFTNVSVPLAWYPNFKEWRTGIGPNYLAFIANSSEATAYYPISVRVHCNGTITGTLYDPIAVTLAGGGPVMPFTNICDISGWGVVCAFAGTVAKAPDCSNLTFSATCTSGSCAGSSITGTGTGTVPRAVVFCWSGATFTICNAVPQCQTAVAGACQLSQVGTSSAWTGTSHMWLDPPVTDSSGLQDVYVTYDDSTHKLTIQVPGMPGISGGSADVITNATPVDTFDTALGPGYDYGGGHNPDNSATVGSSFVTPCFSDSP